MAGRGGHHLRRRDHLDIYGTHEELRRTFARFAGQIKPGGTLIIKRGVELPIANRDIRTYTYACDAEADFHATGLEVQPDGTYRFDIVCPDRTIPDCRLGIPGRVNVENAMAAVALLWVAVSMRQSSARDSKPSGA